MIATQNEQEIEESPNTILEGLIRHLTWNLQLEKDEARRLLHQDTKLFGKYPGSDGELLDLGNTELAELAHYMHTQHGLDRSFLNLQYFKVRGDRDYTLLELANDIYSNKVETC
ncbi:MAG: hypothetical protein AABW46_02850 [Nanoarchaeota archaeon]